MNAKLAGFLCAFCLCLNSVLAGGLGDTVEKLDKEYGKPKELRGDDRIYIKSGGWFSTTAALIVSVEIHDGKVWGVAYRKQEDKPLLGFEVTDLLRMNEQGYKWEKPSTISDSVATFARKDGAALADYSEVTHWMRFWTTEYVVAHRRAEED